MLQHDIGRKSLITEAPGLLGTSVNMVAFVAAGINTVMKKFWIALVTSDPNTLQVALKNPEVKPSGPGDLLLLSFMITLQISSWSGILIIA